METRREPSLKKPPAVSTKTTSGGLNTRSVLEGIFHGSAIGIIVLDSRFHVGWANEAILRNFGVSRKALLGANKRELVQQQLKYIFADPEDFANRLLASYDSNDHVEEFECHVLAGEGRDERWLQHWSQPIDEGPYSGGRVEYYTDITERKQAEHALRENERRFKAVFNQQFQFMAILSQEGIVQDINDLPLRASGVTRDQVVGRLFWDTPFWADLPEFKNAWPGRLAEAAASDASILSEDRFLASDGKVRIADAAITAVKNKNGYVDFFIIQANDITERKRAEHELRESERKNRIIMENVKDFAILSMDIDGVMTSWNPGAENIFGYPEPEVLGQNVAVLFTPEDRALGAPEKERRTAAQKGYAKDERWHMRKNGERFFASGVARPIADASGKQVGFIKVARDVTKQKRMEDQLRDAHENLERMVQERTSELQSKIAELEAFSYSVSHDLRAPLRAMQGYSQFLIEDYGDKIDETGRDFILRIIKAAERLDRLVQDILTYSRVGRVEFKNKSIDVEKLIEDIIHGYPSLHAETVEIEVKRPLHRLMGHEGSLTQCISNILGNAVKFVPSGRTPHIVIWSEEHDGRVRLFFRDNGIGIAPQHQERIFRMFEKAGAETDYEGTGIGLAIVSKAVDRMNGTVGVVSEAGHGSTFWIELGQGS